MLCLCWSDLPAVLIPEGTAQPPAELAVVGRMGSRSAELRPSGWGRQHLWGPSEGPRRAVASQWQRGDGEASPG